MKSIKSRDILWGLLALGAHTAWGTYPVLARYLQVALRKPADALSASTLIRAAEERGADVTKISFRSAPGVNVAEGLAAPMGGGGHPCAAGATVNLPVCEAAQAVLARALAFLQA